MVILLLKFKFKFDYRPQKPTSAIKRLLFRSDLISIMHTKTNAKQCASIDENTQPNGHNGIQTTKPFDNQPKEKENRRRSRNRSGFLELSIGIAPIGMRRIQATHAGLSVCRTMSACLCVERGPLDQVETFIWFSELLLSWPLSQNWIFLRWFHDQSHPN